MPDTGSKAAGHVPAVFFPRISAGHKIDSGSSPFYWYKKRMET